MEEDTFALLDAHGFAVAEHAPIDGEGVVADLKSVRHTLGERSLHLALAGLLERRHRFGWREEVHRHVSTTTQGWLELFQGKKDFAVIVACVLLRFNVNGADRS